VWWKWEAIADRLVTLDTFGSSIDTVLGVYTGASVNTLVRVRQCDDAADDRTSRTRFVASTGTIYYFRVESASFFLTGPITLNLNTIGTPATAANHIAWGRGRLEDRNTAGLISAAGHFDQAVALDAANQEARFLRAITSLLVLETMPAFEALLTDLGIVDSNLYSRNYQVPKDGDNDPVAAPDATTGDIVTYLENELLPELILARTDLAEVGAGFATSLSDSETTERFVKVDFGCVQLMCAGTYAAEAIVHLLVTIDTRNRRDHEQAGETRCRKHPLDVFQSS
jgi:hypothetical protein